MTVHQIGISKGVRLHPLLAIAALMVVGVQTRAEPQKVCPPGSPVDSGQAVDDSIVQAGTPSVPVARHTTWHSMITDLPGDLARGCEASVSETGLKVVGGVGVLTGLLLMTDGVTNRATQDLIHRNPWMQSASSFIEHLGNGRTHLGIAAAFAAAGLIADDSRALRTASQTAEGLLATGIVVQTLKHMTGRESPAAASQSGGVWRFFPNLRSYYKDQPKYYSFPSGHIATTMTTVTIIAENYPEQEWIRPVGYGIVGLVGVSLVGVRYHWYSDLPLGIAIGYVFGTVIARTELPIDGERTSAGGARLFLSPSVGPNGAGVSVGINL